MSKILKPGAPERRWRAESRETRPEIDTIRIYGRAEDRFGRRLELSRETGDVLTTPLLPGLDVPLARVFRD